MKYLLLVYALGTTEPMTHTAYTSSKACFEAQRSFKAAVHETGLPLVVVCSRQRI